MAKKPDAKIIHPRTLLSSMEAYHQDAMALRSTASHALSFMSDETLDSRKVCETLAPMLKEAIDRMDRWIEAD